MEKMLWYPHILYYSCSSYSITIIKFLQFSSSSQTSPASYNADLQYPSVLGFITQIIQLNSHYKILLLRLNSKLDKNVQFLHHKHCDP